MTFSPRPPRWSLIAGLVVAALIAAGALGAVTALAVLGPLPDAPESRLAQDGTRYLDREGRTLYAPADSGTRRVVPLHDVSPMLKAAVLSTEDAAFYRHPGVDPLAILRATGDNLRASRPVSGAGTITQQLVRNLYLTQRLEIGDWRLTGAPQSPNSNLQSPRLGRKAREALLALRLTRQWDKDEVLALYLNHAYFGNLAYGVEAAAQTYFGRPARDLDLAESAMLAGLIQSPAAYDPLRRPEASRARQADVLDLMARSGAVSREQADAAKAEPLAFSTTPFPIAAPHFVAWAQGQIEDALGPRAAHGGLRVVTTLDLGVQRTAEDIVRRRLSALTANDAGNAAVVALDPATGQVLAMVGSADYFDESIDGSMNLALAPRQPGSAMKPFLYALALEGEITAATPLADVRTAFTTRAGEQYVPNNYDGKFHGLVPVREALAGSYNVPAVRLASQIGVGRILAIAAAVGITTLSEVERFDLSVVLGGGETPLLELTGAYAALANGGERRPVSAVLRVEDAAGRVLWRPREEPPVRVFSPEAAWLVTDILSDNQARTPAFGAGSALRVNRPAAVKTGTTSDFRDNWTVGYTPELVVGVWVGNADNRSMRDVSGVTGAAPIWHDIVEDVLAGRPPRPFERPSTLVQAEVCLPSGLKPTPHCPRRRLEWFIPGTEPAVEDTYYRALPICAATGRIATRGCPDGPIVQRVFEFPPAEVIPWARAHGLALPPEEFLLGEPRSADVTQPSQTSNLKPQTSVRIVRPEPGLTVRMTGALPADVQVLPVELLVAGAQPDMLRIEVDGATLAVLGGTPYRASWRLSAGTHRIRVIGMRGGEETVEDEVEVTVLEALTP